MNTCNVCKLELQQDELHEQAIDCVEALLIYLENFKQEKTREASNEKEYLDAKFQRDKEELEARTGEELERAKEEAYKELRDKVHMEIELGSDIKKTDGTVYRQCKILTDKNITEDQYRVQKAEATLKDMKEKYNDALQELTRIKEQILQAKLESDRQKNKAAQKR